MKTTDHTKITYMIFGREHEDVHVWLDETFGEWMGTGHSLFNHWVARHHRQAIDTKYKGNKEKVAVGYLHVVCDIASRWGIYYLPQDIFKMREFLRGQGITLVTRRRIASDIEEG